MRGLATSVVVAFLVLTSVSAAVAGPGGSARVRMLARAPLTLKGVGFAANERIRLTVSLGEQSFVRKLLARRAGTFLVRFPATTYDRCNGKLSVTALGSRGSRVTWELVPLDCPATEGSAPADL